MSLPKFESIAAKVQFGESFFKTTKAAVAIASASSLLLMPSLSIAESSNAGVETVALYTKRSADLTAYTDINRGFRLLR